VFGERLDDRCFEGVFGADVHGALFWIGVSFDFR
jgi:hypothetical protein